MPKRSRSSQKKGLAPAVNSHQAKQKDKFYKKQWKRGAEARCKPCVDPGKGAVNSNQQGQQQMMCCASCKENKLSGSFYKKEQKRGAEARCNECSDREDKKAQQERQKAERERQEALQKEREVERLERDRIAGLKERAFLEANGPQIKMPTFEVPGFGTLWGKDDDYTCPGMVFHQSPPTLESLVGSYDLIFYYSYGGGEENHQNRVTKGSLDFVMDEATGELTGSVAIDKSVKNAIWSHRYDSKITCESGSSDFQVTNMDELENLSLDEVSGTIERELQNDDLSATCRKDRASSIINVNMHSRFSLRTKQKLNQFWTIMHAKTNHFCGCPTTCNFQSKSRHWSGGLRLVNHYPFSSLKRMICG
jgi:hypothetical protein